MTRFPARHALTAAHLLLITSFPAIAQTWSTTTRVSVSTTGEEADGPSAVGFNPGVSLTPDARFVAFHSLATNLVPGDTNGISDVFVRDLVLGTTERVSVTSSGQQAVGDNQGNGSYGPSIDTSGRYVVFSSSSPNLVPGDKAKMWDVFLHDRASGATTRLSVTGSGKSGNGDSYYPSISADGRYVAFYSTASNLVSGDRNNRWDVFLRDTWTNTTERVSLTSTGKEGNGVSYTWLVNGSVSQEGRYVAFLSTASNLVPGDTNGQPDVFVRDMWSGTLERVSVTSSGQQISTGNGFVPYTSLSADGSCVAFVTPAPELAPPSAPQGVNQLYVRDRTSGLTECVSVSTSGEPGDMGVGASFAISAEGRFVVFPSIASNLCACGALQHLLVRDRLLATTTCAAGDYGVGLLSIGDGAWAIAFSSADPTLVAGDTNGAVDVFLVQ